MTMKRETLMSEKRCFSLAVIFCTCTLAACSTPSVVTTSDGETIYTADAPDTDSNRDFVTYKKGGRQVKINKSEVRKIEEVN